PQPGASRDGARRGGLARHEQSGTGDGVAQAGGALSRASARIRVTRMARSPARSKAGHRATVRVRVLPHGEGLDLPAYQTDQAAGMDLVAAVAPRKPVTIAPGKRALIPTGLSLE